MDLEKNIIPENAERIHLVAICGTGMGALAGMLKEMGYIVTGSDVNVYPPMSDFLVEKGIPVMNGFFEDHLSPAPDVVVIGNAVIRQNPEAVAVKRLGIPYCSMPQAINHFAAGGKKQIIVTGTHGKTTTCAVITWILNCAGLDPSFFIGGILKNFKSNFRLGKGEYIIVEGDEYDTAFFDKGPKFLHYKPFIAVTNGIEFDHADIFKDIDQIKAAFHSLFSRIPVSSTLFAADSDIHIPELIKDAKCRIRYFGQHADSHWKLGPVNVQPPWTEFDVFHSGEFHGRFRTRLMGRHNLSNILTAIGIADELSVPVDVVAEALETFEGIRRRQEIRGKRNGITVFDDFAHHPTAVRETIRAVKHHCTNGRLVAVFEPRTNTSMRKIFQDVYPPSFDNADLVCIRHPSRIDKVPPEERFSSTQLAHDIEKRGIRAVHFDDTDSIIDFLSSELQPGDFVLVMSNGGFDNIHERLLDAIEKQEKN